MTRPEFIATMVQTLAETFRVPVSAPAARGYLLALEDVPEERLRSAARLALKECRFMPPPAELRALSRRRPDVDVDSTSLRLEAMKPDPAKLPTREELAALRQEIRTLADSKS